MRIKKESYPHRYPHQRIVSAPVSAPTNRYPHRYPHHVHRKTRHATHHQGGRCDSARHSPEVRHPTAACACPQAGKGLLADVSSRQINSGWKGGWVARAQPEGCQPSIIPCDAGQWRPACQPMDNLPAHNARRSFDRSWVPSSSSSAHRRFSSSSSSKSRTEGKEGSEKEGRGGGYRPGWVDR
jgi:hypothetical protein